MADLPDRAPLDRQRQAFDVARASRRQAQADLAARAAELARLRRTAAADDPLLREALVARRQTEQTATAARADERATQTAVATALRAWLADDPAADVARLDATYPIVLLPVRIETRFFPERAELRVRVYPDEILADAHEPELAAAEQIAGAGYWAAAQAAGGQEQLDAWRQLLASYTPQRAAWIVRATQPGTPQAPGSKPAGWSRAVEARLLPDRWAVLGYRGGQEVRRAFGAPIVEPLALSVGPDTLDSERVDVSGDGLQLNDAVRWTVDWDRAVAVGMGISVPLDPADARLGFDRLVVVGVKASMGPQSTAERLGALLDAHHYTRGLAFVPQGIPTNNTTGSPAGHPPPDPNGTHSLAVERGAPMHQDADAAGGRLASALGVDPGLLAHVDGADLVEAPPASAMNRVLFPATLGYFFDQMLAPLLTRAQVDQLGRHFVQWVLPRGPLSAFRVGRVPYGVLPTTSLSRWQPAPQATPLEQQLPAMLARLRGIWADQVGAVPRVGRSNDPDRDLLDLLSMDASAREVRVRRLVGEKTHANLLALFGYPSAGWSALLRTVAGQVLARIGVDPQRNLRILHMTFNPTAPRYHGELVDLAPLSETAPLASNYIDWIRTATIDQLRAQALPAGFPATITSVLLYRFLRHAALAEYHRWAVTLLATFPPPPNIEGMQAADGWREQELVGIVPGSETRPTPWQRLTSQVVLPTVGPVTIAAFLDTDSEDLRQLTGVGDYRDALAVIAQLPTAELERLFTESLDAASHRLDAWITSLATQRLTQLRTAGKAEPGCFVGAYAWVEDLRPASQPTVTLPDGRVVHTTPGGYVHAPSMTHAMTAAVLRNGYLTHLGQADSPYAVDLSSAQVRAGRFVLDSVRNGQPVGAVLGYQLERALHERKVEGLIDPIRRAAPLVANKAFDAGEPADLVAARNVVDGLLLRTKWKTGRLFGSPDGLPTDIAHRAVLEQELARLDRIVDAVADLLLAESVHQVVRGSTMASSAGLDALAQGVRPPEPHVGRAPTGGITLTHRLALVLGATPMPLLDGWASTATPRAATEPRLDGWVGSLLGDPREVRCRVRYPDATTGQPDHEVTVTLDQLQLRPLDVLALAHATATEPQASELDRRVLHAAFGDTVPADAAPNGPFTIVYEADPAWDRAATRTIPELLDVANALGRVVGGMRPLTPLDVVVPEQASTADQATIQAAELQTRVGTAHSGLDALRANLQAAVDAIPATTPQTPPTAAQAAELRTQLRAAAAYGIAAAFPGFIAGPQEGSVATLPLLDQARGVLADITKRLADFARVAPAATDPATVQVQHHALQAQALFGRDFIALSGFAWPAAATAGQELSQALTQSPELIGADPHVVDRWLQQASRVREPLGRWRMLRLLAEANATPPATWDVAQLPYVPGASWVALPPNANEQRGSGRVSLVLHRPTAPPPDPTRPWYGLFLDEWVETIPNASEHTGIAFRYDDTGGEAAQTILVAVSPTIEQGWSFDVLVAVVNETLDLAKLRGVDGELLGDLGQLLPGIYLAANASDDTISTRLVEGIGETRFLTAETG
jgi:hypothetical protein